MKCYTQTRLVPRTETTKAKGNCWQTCAAAILDLPIEALPDQVDVEDAGWSFNNVLIAYLWKHHGKQLVVLHRWDLRAPIAVQDVYHIICGPSPRTATNGVNHCVVGRAGTAVWDVHPTRAGLIDTNEFQFIIDAASDAIAPRMDFAGRDCICPACGGIPPKPPTEPEPTVCRSFPGDGAVATVEAPSWVFEYLHVRAAREVTP